MKYSFLALALLLTFHNSYAQELKSPNGNQVLTFMLQADGTPVYSLKYKNREVIKPSRLGLQLKPDSASLLKGFSIADTKATSFDESWNPVWGEVKSIRNHYNELAITLNQKATDRTIIIRFRLFDEGL